MACVTLDIEPDLCGYAVDPGAPRYYGLFDDDRQFARFTELLSRHGVSLTCFVVGTVFRDRPDHLRELERLGAEFGSHSMTHDLDAQDQQSEILGGIEAFERFFGHVPRGYRAPFFRLTRTLLETLDRSGVAYDSSYMPSVSPISPGVYRNLRGPSLPFRWQGLSLVELPLATIRHVRLPIGPSYLKVLGRTVFRLARKTLGYPDPLVTFVHPMNLIYSPQAFEQLPFRWKLANSRNRFRGMDLLDWFLLHLHQAGYRFLPMSELYESVMEAELQEIPLPGSERHRHHRQQGVEAR